MKGVFVLVSLFITTLLFLLVEVHGFPFPKDSEVNKEGQMVVSKRCPGVKCWEPAKEKKCNATNNTNPGAMEQCCLLFMCGSPLQGHFSYYQQSEQNSGGQQQSSAGGPPPVAPGGMGVAPAYQFGNPQVRMLQFRKGPGSGPDHRSQSYSYASYYQSRSGSRAGSRDEWKDSHMQTAKKP